MTTGKATEFARKHLTTSEPDLSKAEEAWKLHRRGWNNAQIGRRIGVTREHVRNLLRKQRELAADQLTSEQPVCIVADELAQIEAQLQRCSQFLELLYSQGTIDASTGLKVYTAKQREGIQSQERLVDKIRERKLSLLLDVGIVPKAPEKRELFAALKKVESAEHNEFREAEAAMRDASPEEREEILRHLLKNSRVLL